MAKKPSRYDESAIRILEGLEPVKLRPGQFTRTDNPLHIVQEVLDNAVDEAIAGFAHNISLTLLADGSVSIADDGRGIPVGPHPEKKIPVVQAIFTILYSGGKFDKAAGGAYSYAGGLHGVGVSVTNALSERLDCEVRRDGVAWRIGFADGELAQPLRKAGKATGSGTTVTLRPNPKYFTSPDLPVDELKALLRSKAVLLPGLTATFADERGEKPVRQVWQYASGMAAFLDELVGGAPALVAVLDGSAHADADNESFAEGEGASWVFSWFERGDGNGQSFVNLIPTPQGGTHVAGLRSAVHEALKSFIEFHAMLPKGCRLSADDVFGQVRYVLSVRMLDPSFDNQTKDRLNSRDGVKLVESMVRPSFEAWLNHNVAQAKVIAELAIRNALARQRAAAKVERKRTSSVVMLPGKLADCESNDPRNAELFLVEGDSAGGSAKMARDKESQAVLPMRGKSLNTWEKDKHEALANEEIHDIMVAVGIPPHTLKDELDWGKLRYGKTVILADADVDGLHIQTLLLTNFFRHFPQLIDRGHVFVACPPLFRLDVEGAGKKRGARKIYAMDEAELAHWEERLRKEGYTKWKVGRFKGLGEMDPPELWETTLAPATRRLLRVELPEGLREEAMQTFDNLMNKKKADWRKQWMERRGDEAES